MSKTATGRPWLGCLSRKFRIQAKKREKIKESEKSKKQQKNK
jgi:hypothetical protein